MGALSQYLKQVKDITVRVRGGGGAFQAGDRPMVPAFEA